MTMRSTVIPFLAAALTAAAWAAQAADMEVDLELALAVDISRSVDHEEAALQRSGYVQAFRHPSIVDAIRNGPLGRIAVSYFEWGGYGRIRPVIGWTVIRDAATAEAFSRALETDEPDSGRRTSISGAIEFAAASFADNGYAARRRVIDVSGDGANNSGQRVDVVRDRVVATGITINGLPIVNGRETAAGWRPIENLDLYYRDCVIGGPGAFHVVAKTFIDFPRAILRKLMLEIAGLTPAEPPIRRHGGTAFQPDRLLHLAQMAPGRVAPPCDIGERRWRRRWWGADDLDGSSYPTPLIPR